MLHYQKTLILEFNGLIVKLFKKLEINLTVDHAGPSELLKLYQIEFVLNLDNNNKLEFPVKIYSLVVLDYFLVVWVVTEDILMPLGLTSKKLDLLLEIFMNKIPIVNHTL